jgi:hypothetical protein
LNIIGMARTSQHSCEQIWLKGKVHCEQINFPGGGVDNAHRGQ